MLFAFTQITKCTYEIASACLQSRYCSAATLIRVAIVGTGPAGFYTASQVSILSHTCRLQFSAMHDCLKFTVNQHIPSWYMMRWSCSVYREAYACLLHKLHFFVPAATQETWKLRENRSHSEWSKVCSMYTHHICFVMLFMLIILLIQFNVKDLHRVVHLLLLYLNLEQRHLNILSTMILIIFQDRLPTPFGLVRSGVAPDHQETKVGQIQVVLKCSSRPSGHQGRSDSGCVQV
jgi:hypothetical protein